MEYLLCFIIGLVVIVVGIAIVIALTYVAIRLFTLIPRWFGDLFATVAMWLGVGVIAALVALECVVIGCAMLGHKLG